jgi:hypothetical protein
VALVHALTGLILAALAARNATSATDAPKPRGPREFVPDKQRFVVLPPPDASSKFVRPPQVHPPPTEFIRKPNPCDPPFTIDPANNHKKYKLECLGK